eukprot:COSAG01_NODE_2723_length_7183_cov_9.443111_2_plen_144_part_00
MHVQDADKVRLAEEYEKEIQYKGHCCAVCGIRDVYMVSYLQKLKKYDPREELTKFGPFATLSNAMRHAINRHKLLEYGKHHRLPVIRWRWETTTKTHIPDDVYATEPSMWGYFCEGAPYIPIVNPVAQHTSVYTFVHITNRFP